MKAFILAGGKGTRLRPLTYAIPKPLLPIGRKPILEIIIERLRDHGITDIILSVGYKAELIRTYFGNGNGFNVNITYFQESDPLGTAGPIKLIASSLGDQPFITMNCDLLTDIDFSRMYQLHLEKSAELTMAVTTYKVSLPYGVISVWNTRVESIEEKPEITFLINAGIYVISPSVLDIIPSGRPFNMPDLVQALIHQGRSVDIYHINGKWQDLGTMKEYEKATLDSAQEHLLSYYDINHDELIEPEVVLNM